MTSNISNEYDGNTFPGRESKESIPVGSLMDDVWIEFKVHSHTFTDDNYVADRYVKLLAEIRVISSNSSSTDRIKIWWIRYKWKWNSKLFFVWKVEYLKKET